MFIRKCGGRLCLAPARQTSSVKKRSQTYTFNTERTPVEPVHHTRRDFLTSCGLVDDERLRARHSNDMVGARAGALSELLVFDSDASGAFLLTAAPSDFRGYC